MKINFDNNFYSNKLIYLFLLQNLNNFVSFENPHSNEKTGDCSHSSCSSRILFMTDRMIAQIEVVRKVASKRGMTHYIYIYIYNLSGLIFAKLAYEFNASCLSPIFVKKKVSPMEHMKRKGPTIKLVV